MWYLQAFFLLSNSRQSGMGVGSIPLSEITNYGLVFDVVDDLHTFCEIITAMDHAYIEHANNQSKQKRKQKG